MNPFSHIVLFTKKRKTYKRVFDVPWLAKLYNYLWFICCEEGEVREVSVHDVCGYFYLACAMMRTEGRGWVLQKGRTAQGD